MNAPASAAADLVITPRWVVPIVPAGAVWTDTAVVINGTRIEAVLPAAQAAVRYADVQTLSLPDHVLIPGLVNAHTHAAMSLFKGMADDLPLMTWLNEHIWPAESRWVSEVFVRDGTRLAAAEMLRGGITCFNDMYFFPREAALAAQEAGMRVVAGLIVLDFPTVWAGNADEYLTKAIQVHDELRERERIHTAFAPHAPYTVSDAPLQRVRTLADELDIPVHIHLHETAFEVNESVKQSGRRPFGRLDSLGLLSDRLLAVHMTQMNEDEIAATAEAGVHVIHCPESNMKLASGACPVAKLLAAGTNVALGTDGAASNNDLSLLGEMRTASLLGKLTAGDASAVSAAVCLEMATMGGAKALGLAADIGSIEAGKSADLTAVDLGDTPNQPVYDPISHLVYSAAAQCVSDVWVEGRRVVQRGSLTTVDEAALKANAESWRRRIDAGRGKAGS